MAKLETPGNMIPKSLITNGAILSDLVLLLGTSHLALGFRTVQQTLWIAVDRLPVTRCSEGTSTF